MSFLNGGVAEGEEFAAEGVLLAAVVAAEVAVGVEGGNDAKDGVFGVFEFVGDFADAEGVAVVGEVFENAEGAFKIGDVIAFGVFGEVAGLFEGVAAADGGRFFLCCFGHGQRLSRLRRIGKRAV